MFFFILYLRVKRSLKCNKYTNAIHPANANMCCSQLQNDHRTKITAAIKQQLRQHLIIEMRVCLHWLSVQHSSQVTSRLFKNHFIQQADFKQAAFYSMKLEKQFQCHFQLELLLLEPKASWVVLRHFGWPESSPDLRPFLISSPLLHHFASCPLTRKAANLKKLNLKHLFYYKADLQCVYVLTELQSISTYSAMDQWWFDILGCVSQKHCYGRKLHCYQHSSTIQCFPKPWLKRTFAICIANLHGWNCSSRPVVRSIVYC